MKVEEASASYLLPIASDAGEWRQTTLGEMADFEMGQAPPGSECNKEGIGTVFVKAGEFGSLCPVEVEWTTKPLKFGKKGDVFICVVGATAGKLNLGIDCAIGRSVAAIRPKKGIDTKFIYYQLQPWVLKLRASSAGSAQGVISKAQLSEVPLLVAPLVQQKRIVAEIEKQFSRLDEAVAGLKRVKANLKRYKAAVLKAAVEGRLVETEADRARREGRSFETGEQLLQRILETRRNQWQGKGKYKEPAAPDTTDLPELPEGWVWSSVDQLAEVGTGATPKRDQARYYGGGIPWVTSAVVNDTFVDYAAEFVTGAALEETNLTLYPPGTLLVAMYGEGKTRGKCSELRIAATTNQALAALRADENVRPYLKQFLEYNYEEMRKVASGGVQQNLNLSLVRAVCVPLPPMAEQHRIVSEVDHRLSLLRETESQVDANLLRANRLRQSILSKEFNSQ